MQFVKLIILVNLLSLAGCGSMFLKTLNEVPKSQYEQIFNGTADQMIRSMKTSGTVDTKGKWVSIPTIATKVAHQNKLPNKKGNTMAEHESAWGGGKNSIYGFRGATNIALDDLTDNLKKQKGYGTVYSRMNAGALKHATSKAQNIKFPIGLPEEVFNKQYEHTRMGVVTSYKRVGVGYDKASKISTLSLGPIVYPYFTMTMKKTGAGLTKLNGELLLNYKAKIKGYVLVCQKGICASAESSDVAFTMPLISYKHFSDKKVHKELDAYFQHELGHIMGKFSVAAFEKLSSKN